MKSFARLNFLLLAIAVFVAGCGRRSTTPVDTGDAAVVTDSGTVSDGAQVTTHDSGLTTHDSGAADSGFGMSAIPASHNVRVIVEPGDNAAALIAAIQRATTSVHMTMYLLTNTDIINSLINQHRSGLDVKVILNQTFPGGTTGSQTNSSAYSALQNGGVDVHWASSSYTYTHEKCVILDLNEAWIMTMNATQSSARYNREYLAIDDEADDVADAESIFEADWNGTAYSSYSGRLVLSPVNAQSKIAALVAGATQTVLLQDEELGSSQISPFVAAARRGVQVHVILGSNSVTNSDERTAISELKTAGAMVSSLSTPTIHAKAIVVDGMVAFVGSENLTTTSILQNRELGVVFDGTSQVHLVESTIENDFQAGTPL